MGTLQKNMSLFVAGTFTAASALTLAAVPASAAYETVGSVYYFTSKAACDADRAARQGKITTGTPGARSYSKCTIWKNGLYAFVVGPYGAYPR